MTLYGKFEADEKEYIVIHRYKSVDGTAYEQEVVHQTGHKIDEFISEVPIAHKD